VYRVQPFYDNRYCWICSSEQQADVTAAILKVRHHIKIWLCQSILIYLKNNPAKFHPDPIWNDRALGQAFFRSITPTTRRTITRSVSIWDQYLIQKQQTSKTSSTDTFSGSLYNNRKNCDFTESWSRNFLISGICSSTNEFMNVIYPSLPSNLDTQHNTMSY